MHCAPKIWSSLKRSKIQSTQVKKTQTWETLENQSNIRKSKHLCIEQFWKILHWLPQSIKEELQERSWYFKERTARVPISAAEAES